MQALVTGAFGNTGRAIASRLLQDGYVLRTLTGHAEIDPFDGQIEVWPYAFDDPTVIQEALTGCQVLYNTYWVRFDQGRVDREIAVRNSRILFDAARRAGVERVVHLSITNPDLSSPHPYFRGKALVELALQQSGLNYTILRPAVIFGGENILINNICWLLRKFPIYGLFGDGRYLIQPIHIADLADLAVTEGQREGKRIMNAIGPETLEFRELVNTLARAMGLNRPLVPLPPTLCWIAGKLLGLVLRDRIVSWGEIRQLQQGLLVVSDEARGRIPLTDWAHNEADRLGRSYANELARRRPAAIA